jgi:hypothetical protein
MSIFSRLFKFGAKKTASVNSAVRCSVCGKPLKPIGNLLDEFKASGWQQVGTTSDKSWEQWLGTVCTNCRKVYCPDCCDAGGGPCPSCKQNVKPATASFLPNDERGKYV